MTPNYTHDVYTSSFIEILNAMDESGDLRESVLEYVRNAFEVEKKPPTIRNIAENVEGVNRSNIYTLFPQGIKEICKAAGIDVPSKRIKETKKASKARKTKRDGPFPDITLRDQLAQELWVTSTLEDRKPQDLMEELLDQSKVLRTQYGLTNRDIADFTMFLKNCEKNGLRKEQIVNSLKKFTRLRLELLFPYRFDMLIKLRESMLSRDLEIEDLYAIYTSTLQLYQDGYMLCLDYVKGEVLRALPQNTANELTNALVVATDVKYQLVLKIPRRI